jgi:antiviral helicase SKI2
MIKMYYLSINHRLVFQIANPRTGTGVTSTAFDRAPGPSKNFVRGKSGYVPFWPGGLDEAVLDPDGEASSAHGKEGLRTVPPGFSRGLHLPGHEIEDESLVYLGEPSGTESMQKEPVVITDTPP